MHRISYKHYITNNTYHSFEGHEIGQNGVKLHQVLYNNGKCKLVI